MGDKLYALEDVLKYLRSQDTLEDAIRDLSEGNVELAIAEWGDRDDDSFYQEAQWNMDKFMSDDESTQEAYEEALDRVGISAEERTELVASVIMFGCVDEDRMLEYFPEDGSVHEFAEYIVRTMTERNR